MPKKDAESQQGSVKVDDTNSKVERESSIASVSGATKAEGDKDDESDVEEAGEVEEDESDLDLAWKMLDLARAISEKISEETHDMVDILSALAEVSLEREDIDTSLSDYQKALSILERLDEPDSRQIAELNFRICLCLEVGSKAQEAIPYCEKALSVCKSRMQRLMDEMKSISGPPASSAVSEAARGDGHSAAASQSEKSVSDRQAEIETLTNLSSDLEKKLEDQQLSNPSSILSDILGLVAAKAKAKEQATSSPAASSSRLGVATNNGDFDSATVSTAQTNGSSSGITHLGVVGRGVKRVNMSSSNVESSSTKRPALERKPETDGSTGP